MAHELCFIGGKAQAFTVGDKSWHGLEQNLDRAPSYDEALAKYGLIYPLEKRPYSRPCPTSPSGWIESGDAFYVERTDTGKVLGSVGQTYEIVGNADAFAPLKPLVDEGLLTLETGGVLRNGADAWMLGRWAFDRMGPICKEVFGSEVIPFSAVLANHNGRRGILLGNTPIRIVCANTLGASEQNGASRWVSVSHTGDAKGKLIEAAESIFNGVVQRYEAIAGQYKLLKGFTLSERDFTTLVLDTVVPDPRQSPKFNPEAKLANVVVERATKKREEIRRLWTEGQGHTGEPNAWFAYNAVAEAIDHSPLYAKRDGSWQSRGLMGGVYTKMKNDVLDLLVQYAMGV